MTIYSAPGLFLVRPWIAKDRYTDHLWMTWLPGHSRPFPAPSWRAALGWVYFYYMGMQ